MDLIWSYKLWVFKVELSQIKLILIHRHFKLQLWGLDDEFKVIKYEWWDIGIEISPIQIGSNICIVYSQTQT